MSFNDNANLDISQVESGGGGGRGGLAVGGGVGGIVVLILTLLFGGNITSGGTSGRIDPGQNTQLDPGQVQPGGAQANDFSQCRTGADANRDVQCRVIGTVNSVQDYWTNELPRYGKKYRNVGVVEADELGSDEARGFGLRPLAQRSDC